MTPTATILVGDVLERMADLPPASVQLCVSSPPYYALRSYLPADHPDKAREMGSECSLDCLGWATCAPCGTCWVCHQVAVLAAVRRVLRPDGVCWWNVGDSYACTPNGRSAADTKAAGNDDRTFRDKPACGINSGLKPKDMCLAPSRLALALQADGWWVRSMCPWVKRSAMPSSVTDRPSTSLEWMIMLTPSARYFYDQEAVRRATVPDPRDQRWGQTAETSRHGHEVDAEQGMMQTRTQANGYVRMSNPSGRNLRDSDWWFDSVGMLLRDEVLGFDVVSEPSREAHYASYPRRLLREIIASGTPEVGVCGECGAPWVRVVEKGALVADAPGYKPRGRVRGGDGFVKNGLKPAGETQGHPNHHYEAHTLGWRPTCPHTSAPRVPATVLDPFAGTGTTLAAALEYGRSAVGIELSEEYAAIARRRLAGVEAQPLLPLTPAPAPPTREEQGALVMEE